MEAEEAVAETSEMEEVAVMQVAAEAAVEVRAAAKVAAEETPVVAVPAAARSGGSGRNAPCWRTAHCRRR